MNEKRFTYTTRIISDKKAYYKDYILDKETLLNTEQIVRILNAQADYINYVTKERNLACNKLDKQQATIQSLQNEIDELKKDIDIYKYEEKKHSESARKLYEENEQLQKRLEHYKEVEAMNGDGKNE